MFHVLALGCRRLPIIGRLVLGSTPVCAVSSALGRSTQMFGYGWLLIISVG